MSITTAIIITLVAIFFSGFFSGSEIAFVQSSKVRMELDAARGGLVDRVIKAFTRHEDMFISTILVGNNVVLVIYGITFSILVNPILENIFNKAEAPVLICNTVLSTAIILIAGEFLPKTAFRVNPNAVMRVVALPLYIIYILLYPVTLLVSAISRGLMKLMRIQSDRPAGSLLTIDQLDDYIEESLESGDTQRNVENEVKIFHRAIDFKDTTMSECMIPRNEIVAVALDGTSREELIRLFISSGLSKIVVYKSDIDDVAGYIHVNEMFKPDTDWRRQIKPVIYTPGTMLANKMMRRMMAENKSLVIVVDEFGGTDGLATLEDLVEEIFGEIEDEHDKHKIVARKISDKEYELSGRAEIDFINERFGLDLKESEDYETLAGYLLEFLGALPEPGIEYQIQGKIFVVNKMSATKIELVTIKIPD